MGVKKSTVATNARSGAIRNTAASSPVPAPTSTRGSVSGGSAWSTCPSSTGLSLQAQPAPWLYSVSLILSRTDMAEGYVSRRRDLHHPPPGLWPALPQLRWERDSGAAEAQ